MTEFKMTSTVAPIRVGVSGFLRNSSGHLLLGKRHPSCSLPNLYCTPGGKLEYQEPMHVGLMREFKEETNLDIHVGKLLCVQEQMVQDRHSIILFYQVVDRGISPMRMKADEFTELGFFSELRLAGCEEMLTPATKRAIEHYLTHHA